MSVRGCGQRQPPKIPQKVWKLVQKRLTVCRDLKRPHLHYLHTSLPLLIGLVGCEKREGGLLRLHDKRWMCFNLAPAPCWLGGQASPTKVLSPFAIYFRRPPPDEGWVFARTVHDCRLRRRPHADVERKSADTAHARGRFGHAQLCGCLLGACGIMVRWTGLAEEK